MKRILVFVLFALGLVASISAQTPSVSAQTPKVSVTEMKYFTIESSVVMGYNIPAEDITAGSSFLLNFAVSDNFTFGVQTMTLDGAAAAISSMKLSYYLNTMLGFSATFGGNGTDAYYSAGAFVTLLRNVRETALSDAFKLRIEYIFPDTGIGDGSILMGAGFCLGL